DRARVGESAGERRHICKITNKWFRAGVRERLQTVGTPADHPDLFTSFKQCFRNNAAGIAGCSSDNVHGFLSFHSRFDMSRTPLQKVLRGSVLVSVTQVPVAPLSPIRRIQTRWLVLALLVGIKTHLT